MVVQEGTPEYDYISLEIFDCPDFDNGAIGLDIPRLSKSLPTEVLYQKLCEKSHLHNIFFDADEQKAICEMFERAKHIPPFFDRRILRQGDLVIMVNISSHESRKPEPDKEYLLTIGLTVDKYSDAYTYDV